LTPGNTIELIYDLDLLNVPIKFKTTIIKYDNDWFFVTPYGFDEKLPGVTINRTKPYQHSVYDESIKYNSYICDDYEGVGSLLMFLLGKNSPLWIKNCKLVKYNIHIKTFLNNEFSYLG